MSGIEVVGLILAVVPLFISGLEHSDKAFRPLRAFLHKPEELKRFCHALGDQTTLLRLSIQELFGDLNGLSSRQTKALSDDNDDLSALWADESLTNQIKVKLGSPSGYRSYIGNLERTKCALETLGNVSEPFVSHIFDSPQRSSQVQVTQANTLPPLVHGNLSLLSRGIILLELYFGESIESKRREEDLSNGAANSSTDLNVARRWMQDCFLGNMSLRYWKATNHCITCFFDPMPKSTSFHDEDFRESVYQKIVLELETELEEWDK